MKEAATLQPLTWWGMVLLGAFLLFFLVVVTADAQITQELASRHLRRRPTVRQIDRSFSWRAWGLGVLAAGALGASLFWITPVKPGAAALMGKYAGLVTFNVTDERELFSTGEVWSNDEDNLA